LGVSYFSLNNFERSAAVFEEFAKTFPTDELAKSAVLNAAISYSRVGDVEKTTLAYLNYASCFRTRTMWARRIFSSGSF
jgi:hypothetical protein